MTRYRVVTETEVEVGAPFGGPEDAQAFVTLRLAGCTGFASVTVVSVEPIEEDGDDE